MSETKTEQTPVELVIRDLHAKIEDKEILRGVNLTVRQGETHALMGPNGSGKSTLANVIMGHPKYVVTQGEILFKGVNILELSADKRARMGLFLAFQYPSSVPGVTVANFLRRALEAGARATIPTRRMSRPARRRRRRASRPPSSASSSPRR